MSRYILTIAFVLVFSITAFSCTCGTDRNRDDWQKIDLLIRGKVILIDTLITVDTIKFKAVIKSRKDYDVYNLLQLKVYVVASRVYRGTLSTNDTALIATGTGEGDCGFEFRLNQEYIVWGKKENVAIIDPSYWTNKASDKKLKEYISHKTFFETNICYRTHHVL
jgi:hypothetical protein